MNRQQQAQNLAQALALLEAVANANQDDLQERITRCQQSIPINSQGQWIGRIIGCSRRVDTLERICSELAAMINQPPPPSIAERIAG